MDTIELPPEIIELVRARNALRDRYTSSGLRFTLDGNLVGDLGEALAAETYGLTLQSRSKEGIDGMTADGRTVQIKASGTGRGPVFRQVTTSADHLLFFHFDFENCLAKIIYNGPERYILELMPHQWIGQRMAPLGLVKAANDRVLHSERLLPSNGSLRDP